MIELAKHIEVLLLENDCVIVPGLGGFIAHNRPAAYSEKERSFVPPMRTVGFNPQLVINDGLLVQSYMQAYNTDFPDATRKIEKTVNALKEQLYQQGSIELEQIGTLYYNMNGDYEFEPVSRSFFTPGLYGLDEFDFSPFIRQTAEEPRLPAYEKRDEKQMLPLYNWLRSAIAVAAAVLLFFILSTPVENTYIDDANFASLGSIDMFDIIRDQSMATALQVGPTENGQTENKRKKDKVRNNVNTLKPVKVRTETVAAVEKVEEKKLEKPEKVAPKEEKKEEKKQKEARTSFSYIIVASLASDADAQNALKEYHKNAYKDAEVVESNGRFRIALHRYADSSDAYRKVKEVRKDEKFKNAWVFTAK